jgi:2-dehydropantoate 2-reductase
MRICVFGAGAVGGHLAVRLALAGHQVSAVARGAHLSAIQLHGLHLRQNGRHLRTTVRASASPTDLGEQDVVIVTTKATALPQVAQAIGPLLGRHTLVVFAQNGIPWWYGHGRPLGEAQREALSVLDPQGTIARAVGLERVVGAVIFSSNETVSPGVIQNDSPNANALVVAAPDDQARGTITRLRQALRDSGFESPDPQRIRAAVWQKLQVNLSGSTLCLLLEQPVSAIGEAPEIGALFQRLLEEARAIAAALGDLADATSTVSLPTAQPQGSHKPSILVDHERGRPLELDAIVRVPLLLGRSLGVPCPVLETVSALATARARARGLYA